MDGENVRISNSSNSKIAKRIENVEAKDFKTILSNVDTLSSETDTKKFLLTFEEQLSFINSKTSDLIRNSSMIDETKEHFKILFGHLKNELKDDDNQILIKKAIEKIYAEINKNIEEFEKKLEAFQSANSLEYTANIEWLKTLEEALGEGSINAVLNLVDDSLYKSVSTALSNLDIQEKVIEFLKIKLEILDKIDKAKNSEKSLEKQRVEPLTHHLISVFKKQLQEINVDLNLRLSRKESLNDTEQKLIERLLLDNKETLQLFESQNLTDEESYAFIVNQTSLDSKRVMFDLQKVQSVKNIFQPLVSTTGVKKVFSEGDLKPVIELLSSVTIDLVLKKTNNIDGDITFLFDNLFEKNPDYKQRILSLYEDLHMSSGNELEDIAVLFLLEDLEFSKTHRNLQLNFGNSLKENLKNIWNKSVKLFKSVKNDDDRSILDNTQDGTRIIGILNEFKGLFKTHDDFKDASERTEYLNQIIIMLKRYGFKDNMKDYIVAITDTIKMKRPYYSEIIHLNEKINQYSSLYNFKNDDSEDNPYNKTRLKMNKKDFLKYLEENNISLDIKKDVNGSNMNNVFIYPIPENAKYASSLLEESEFILDNVMENENDEFILFLGKDNSLESFVSKSSIVKNMNDLKMSLNNVKNKLIEELTTQEGYINIDKNDLLKEIDDDLTAIFNDGHMNEVDILNALNTSHIKWKNKLNSSITKATPIPKYEEDGESNNNYISRTYGSSMFEKINEKSKEFDAEENTHFFKDETYEKNKTIKDNSEIAIPKRLKTTKAIRSSSMPSRMKNWLISLWNDSYENYFNEKNELKSPEKIEEKHISQSKDELENVLKYFYKGEFAFDDIEKGKGVDYSKWRNIIERHLKMINIEDKNGLKEFKDEATFNLLKNDFMSNLINMGLLSKDFNNGSMHLGNQLAFKIFHGNISGMYSRLDEEVFQKETFDKDSAELIISKYFSSTVEQLGAKAHVFNKDTGEELLPDRKTDTEIELLDYIEQEFNYRKSHELDYNQLFIEQIIRIIKEIKENLEMKISYVVDEIDYWQFKKQKNEVSEKDLFKVSEQINASWKELEYHQSMLSDLKAFYESLNDNFNEREEIEIEFHDRFGFFNRSLDTFESDYQDNSKNERFKNTTMNTMNRVRNRNILLNMQNTGNSANDFASITKTFTDFSNGDSSYEYTRKVGFNDKIVERYKERLNKMTNPEEFGIILNEMKELFRNTSNTDYSKINLYIQEQILGFFLQFDMPSSEAIVKFFKEDLKNSLKDFQESEDINSSVIKKYSEHLNNMGESTIQKLNLSKVDITNYSKVTKERRSLTL